MFFTPAQSRASFGRSYLNNVGYVPHVGLRADTLDRFLSDVAEGANQRGQIESDETSITLSLDVPGLSKEQLTIGIEGRIVRISSKDDAPRTFKATYKLGSDVDAAQSEAKLENGVLTMKFTKVAPESRQTLLTIN